jgi:pSer/pThr/pTyr-binding forkhead associated (FHA) protein
MNFCKMCGTSLAPRPQAAPAPVADPPSAGAAQKTTCSACGKQTPAGFAFCQHCGQRLGAAPAAAPATAGGARNLGVAPTLAVNPTPPAGMAKAAPAVARAQPPTVNEEALAATVAPPPAKAAAPAAVTKPAASPAPHKPSPEILEASPVGNLVALNRDGSDGESVRIVGDAFDIGRTEGSLKFADDVYLAARHLRLVWQGGRMVLRPLDTVNGVYLRVHGSCDLQPGDQFLVGKEVLRYEALAAEERDPAAMMEHGVRIFGSVPREAWGRLRQLTVAGTTRDVWHLVRPELVLGREEGDVTFPDDEFMSRRHAAVRRTGPKARLEDLNSSNGTFVRVRGDRELKSGDVIRLGDQLLRLEL